jgi:hypothetical protein
MPRYLKAGVYYATKLESIRKQTKFHPKNFAYELLVQAANQEYMQGNYSNACHKFEEAYSIWCYFRSSDPQWSLQTIEDSKLEEINWKGNNDSECKQIE